MKQSVISGALAVLMLARYQAFSQQTGPGAASVSPQQTTSQQTIPDAPKPQTIQSLGNVTPGIGTTSTSAGDQPSPAAVPDADAPKLTNPAPLQQNGAQDAVQDKDEDQTPPDPSRKLFTLPRQRVNFVQTTFTVKDSKGRLVPGIDWREVRIYENNLRQHISVFTSDPFPLSVALVIDQSVQFQTMEKVNNALAALQGAFAPYDEVAIFTYNNGVKMQDGFEAATSARVTAVLEQSKGVGRDPIMGLSGPLAQTTLINDTQFDPNTSPIRNQQGVTLNAPKEYHTLNDAILEAAVALTKTGRGRRRVIYVISDGKEYGSAAKFKQVVQYLQTHEIQVYATIVGDSALPVLGFLDRYHLPFQMKDDELPKYTAATGGQLDAENRTGGIETSFAKITEDVRTQYTVGYYTHEPFIDGKFRHTEVKVLRPSLTVISRDGYFPSAQDAVLPALTPTSTTPAPATPPPAN